MSDNDGKKLREHVKVKLLDFLKQSQVVSTSAKGKRMIRDGMVLVNGVRSTSASQMVTFSQVKILDATSENSHAPLQAFVDPILIVYHKPCNLVCTASTVGNHPFTLNEVYNHKRPIPYHFKPVGRLDQHSHGLLLFSSDGRLSASLLSPTTAINRTYEIIVQGNVGLQCSPLYNSIIEHVRNGVQTEYGLYKGTIMKMQCDVPKIYVHLACGSKCGAERTDGFRSKLNTTTLSSITISINEGKKRMIRRMFASLGYFVVDLKRLSYGEVHLGDVQYGEWRFATAQELEFAKFLIEEWGSKRCS